MRIIVFGVGVRYNHFLMYGLSDSTRRSEYEIIYAADNLLELQGQKINGMPVIPPSMIPGVMDNESIDAIVITVSRCHLYEVVRQLQSMKVTKPVYFWDYQDNTNERFKTIDIKRPSLPYLECDVVRHCNLNCSGCGHISNISTQEYLHEEEIVKDFSRMADMFSNVDTIRLMGGEPFLHPKLSVILCCVRELFPFADIRIVTNGILIPHGKQELFSAIKETNTILDISLYRPTFEKWFEIKKILQYEKIVYDLSEPVTMFYKACDLHSTVNYIENFSKCVAPCVTLRHGRLYRCGFMLLLKRLKHHYPNETDGFWKDLGDINGINIHDTQIDGWEVEKRLHVPRKICAYCHSPNWWEQWWQDEKIQLPWECKKEAKFGDWIYGI